MTQDAINKKDNIIHIRLPYRETVWGELYMTLEKDSDVSREEFLKGIREGTIDPFDYSKAEDWQTVDSDNLDIDYYELEETNDSGN